MSLSARKQALWTAMALVVGLGVSWLLLVGKPTPQPEARAELPPPTVDVIAVEPAARAIAVDTQGTVEPLHKVSLVSQVSGRVEAIADSFADGGFFRAGEELLGIESVDYELAIARARSQVAAAEQRLAEERGRARQAKREWRDLGTVDANALFLREPQIAAAEAALAGARADLRAAELDLERTRISLPFNGRISARHVGVGQYLGPATVVAEAYATDVVQVRLPLTDRQVALLDLPLTYAGDAQPAADPVPVTLEARFGNRQWQWQGRIVRTDASIDVDSRVVYAVAEVREPFAREPGSDRPPLAPGLFVHASIEGRSMAAVSVLPRSALRNDDSVLVVDGRERTLPVAVQVLQGDARQVWVQGLQRGDRVVVHQPPQVTAGTLVTTREVSSVAGVDKP
ncbi:efflux RND transporter periplasmic adaptor subunit [Parahaliea mediterranea]|uniref:efflux RND transporter periplasmic adaptor subunit n=1 Tax=Parahaliea mediterranea TaxID=651086 RepID=UPI001300B627|nr:efflux RND transporter periplasmic adaptor subunit [Parahaliea mediterranea]